MSRANTKWKQGIVLPALLLAAIAGMAPGNVPSSSTGAGNQGYTSQ